MRLKYLIGSKSFYKSVFALTIPIMVQNGITNFVNMLDNIMVGRVGTAEMTGVAIANQLIFVFNLCIFGAISGAGIFGAQFFGKGDVKGIRYVFRFKIMASLLLTFVCFLIFIFLGPNLINLYLKGEGTVQDALMSFKWARQYMLIMLIGFIPYTLSQCYSSTLRETGQSVLPMLAGIVAVTVNVSLNYVLIFGKFGAPRLGVLGAAIATVISRFAELFVLAGWVAAKKQKNEFIIGAFKSLYVPLYLAKQIFLKGLPLMVNETLWAAGMAFINQCYSVRGLNVVAANNINLTFFNVFSVAYMAIGVSIGIILGQTLGAGKTKNAKQIAWQLITFSVVVSAVVSALYYIAAPFIPLIYNVTSEVQKLAVSLMRICALTMPLEAFVMSTYFTLRSGGKALITFLFDSCFIWVVYAPVAFVLSRFTGVPILTLYLICQLLALIKVAIGSLLVQNGSWIKNIVE